MSSVVIAGDTSGAITLAAPAVAGTNTITLPAATGELSMLGGTGQTWQVVTRTSGTTYTNTTGKPIIFAPFYTGGVAGYISLTIGGYNLGLFGPNTSLGAFIGAFVVPPGSTYVYTAVGASPSTNSELR
jgi:hypothetical protein